MSYNRLSDAAAASHKVVLGHLSTRILLIQKHIRAICNDLDFCEIEAMGHPPRQMYDCILGSQWQLTHLSDYIEYIQELIKKEQNQ